MALTDEQISELKKQLKSQVQHLPPEQKKEAEKQIDSMSPGAVEAMLKKQLAQQKASNQANQQIFRLIVSGEIPARIIDQNSQAIAVLDIKPISKGHTVIIPKTQVKNQKELPAQAFTLAKKIAKKISTKLKATDCEIIPQNSFEEIVLNVIPIYDVPVSLDSPRQETSDSELAGIYNKLKKSETKVIKERKPKSTGIKYNPFRIP